LFGETVFRRLFTLSGDAGASSLLRDEPSTRSVDWPAGEIDIDTTRDLARLFDELGEPRRPVDYLCNFDPLAAHGDPLAAHGAPTTSEDRP
jgi:hypothetical protein